MSSLNIVIMKIIQALLVVLVLISTSDISAQRSRTKFVTVKGKVTDMDRKGIEDVQMFLDMNRTKVKSNKKGDFKIKVAPKNKLLTAYHPEYGYINLEYDGERKITFQYPDNSQSLSQNEMEELGYDFEIKKENWYSGYNSVIDILTGRFSNVRVQSNGEILIGRMGPSSVTGDQTPLLLVNDVPTDMSQLDQIPTTEIESIRVLHKTVETANYGIRGANGVIVIELKDGDSKS